MSEQKPNRRDKDSSIKKDRSNSPRSEGRSGDKPVRKSGERSSESRSESKFGDRKPARSYGDKPERKPTESKFGDRKPTRSYGDKPERKTGERTFESRGESKFGDKKPSRTYASKSYGDKPERRTSESKFGDRKPVRSYGDKPEGRFNERDDKKPRERASIRPERSDTVNSRSKFIERPGRKAFIDRSVKGDNAPVRETQEVFKELDESNTYEDETRNTFIFGRHPVIEALKGETPVNKVWIGENTRDTSEIVEYIKEKNIPYKIVNKIKLNHMVGENSNHQGVVAEISGKEYTEFADLLELCQTKTTFFIILDKIEDPHNLGAIIRTADAAGVDAIIIPKYRAVGLTGIVAKTAAGALDRMKVSRVTNLAQAIDELKENNVWSVGVDMDGDKVYTESDFKGSIALVMGGEGQGLTRLLKEKCDFVVKIPMQQVANSLNVSVATALMIYEVYRQRQFK